MDTIAQELRELRSDIMGIREKCESAYIEVKEELQEKEDILKQLYQHNLELVKKYDKKQ